MKVDGFDPAVYSARMLPFRWMQSRVELCASEYLSIEDILPLFEIVEDW